MSLFSVDVEADGPYPGDYSMVSFGAVLLQADLAATPRFKGEVAPISDQFKLAALASCYMTRERHLTFESPAVVMPRFAEWLGHHSIKRPIFISDNPAFDWQWINHYMHRYTGSNPFGWSGRRIGDFHAGVMKDFQATGSWRRFRKTPHTHDPVDDAMGNAEALIGFCEAHRIILKM